MASEKSSGIERITKLWPVALLIGFGAALVWFSNVKQSGHDIAKALDRTYHHRTADGSLLQLARIPKQSPGPVVRYMATLENRSDDPLLVTSVVYDIQETDYATVDMNAAQNTSADAGPMRTAEAYELAKDCEKGTEEPLVPPFRIEGHKSGSFEIKVHNQITSERRWGCTLEVSFRTNQGKTNGVVPEQD